MVAGGLTGLALMAGMSASAPSAEVLAAAWADYVRVTVHKSGRVIDRKGGRISTSEGQAYGMLRAVWVGDRSTFDQIDAWTVRHLQDRDPAALPAWKWGRKRLRRKVLDPQPATDADILIAWSLLLAAERFDAPEYRARAKTLVQTIWDTDVHRVGDRLVLDSDDTVAFFDHAGRSAGLQGVLSVPQRKRVPQVEVGHGDATLGEEARLVSVAVGAVADDEHPARAQRRRPAHADLLPHSLQRLVAVGGEAAAHMARDRPGLSNGNLGVDHGHIVHPLGARGGC